MKRLEISIGATYRHWTVVEPAADPSEGGARPYWLCRCACGRTSAISSYRLCKGLTTACRRCAGGRKGADLSGQQFGGWSVIKSIPRRERKDKCRYCAWLCRCKCGYEQALSSPQLKRSLIGCRLCASRSNGQTMRARPYEAIFNSARAQIASRNIRFDISYETFLAIIEAGRCHYCHVPLVWAKYTTENSDRTYKLDRKDNGAGYVSQNVVAACKRCNYGKSDQYSYEEWFGMTAYFRRG